MPTKQDEKSAMSPIGQPQARIDGPLKVSGTAIYTSDHSFPRMLYAVPIGATIASGKITGIETRKAEMMSGVRAVYHRANIGPIYRTAPDMGFSAYIDEKRPPFEDDIIRYYGQYVAVAIADTFEQATAAADAIQVTYAPDKLNVATELLAGVTTDVSNHRGDTDAAFTQAPVQIDATYATPTEHHNSIELHATVAVWDGASVTLYETIQGIMNQQAVMMQMLGQPKENVRVISKFLGSGFGGKISAWTHCSLAAAAARKLNRPVKLVISRQQAFEAAGHRPATEQRMRLGATQDGKLVSLQQDYANHTSIQDDYRENCGEATPYLYSVPNLKITAGLAKRNVGTPTSMRGPGAVPGLFATESAMDELAIKLKMDPIQLRILNEPKIDEGLNLPFSSRHLVECYTTGADKFGWSKRTPEVGSMKRDDLTLGWGVAGCSWIAERFAADASVELRADGTARVASGTQDIGTGTYTIMAQMVSERSGVPVNRVEVVLGDSSLPAGPMSGGSMATASLVPAVLQAMGAATQILLMAATSTPGSKFNGMKPDDLAFTDGKVHLKTESPSAGVSFGTVLDQARLQSARGRGSSQSTFGAKPTKSVHCYGAQFAEVTWHAPTARLRVSRFVTVIDAGKIINPRAGRNQIEGAVAMGIGMALFEETNYDPRNGAPINSNLADYVMATNPDVPPIDVHFLDYPDLELNELGAKGIGEIGLAGVAPAITNAVYHATGVRVRELPVRIEDLLRAA